MQGQNPWHTPPHSTAEEVASENVEKVIYAPIQGNVIPKESRSGKEQQFSDGM